MAMLTKTVSLLLLLCSSFNLLAIEEAKFNLALKERDFELRWYEPHIVAETVVESDFAEAGNKAFNRLFKYISGNNQSQQEIAMTTPVGQGAASQKIEMTSPVGQQQQDGRWVVSFMMPAAFSMDTLPRPKDPQVVLRQVPARYMAAVRYSGFWSEKSFLKHKTKLVEWVNEKGWQVNGEVEWARYNGPLTPWFLRRNEVLVPVTVTEN